MTYHGCMERVSREGAGLARLREADRHKENVDRAVGAGADQEPPTPQAVPHGPPCCTSQISKAELVGSSINSKLHPPFPCVKGTGDTERAHTCTAREGETHNDQGGEQHDSEQEGAGRRTRSGWIRHWTYDYINILPPQAAGAEGESISHHTQPGKGLRRGEAQRATQPRVGWVCVGGRGTHTRGGGRTLARRGNGGA